MSFPNPFWSPIIPAAAASAASISYRTTTGTETVTTVFTYTNVDVGTAASDRLVVVGIAARGNGGASISLNSLTVGGVTATVVANAGSVANHADIAVAAYTALSTATLVFTWSGSAIRMACSVWAANNMTATATSTSTADTTNTYSAGLDIPAGGAGFGTVMDLVGSGTTAAWTNLTEDFDNLSGNEYITSASQTFAAVQTGLAISCALGASSGGRLAVASFGPA